MIPRTAAILLVCHAMAYSTPFFRIAAALAAAAGLGLAAFVHVPRAAGFLLAAAGAVAVVSLSTSAAPGPTVESLGLLAGALGWCIAGSARGREGDEGSARVFAAAAIALALPALIEWLASSRTPRLWYESPLDLGAAILVLGWAGFRAIESPRARIAYAFLVISSVASSSSRALIIAALLSLATLPVLRLRAKAALALVVLTLSLPYAVSRVGADPLAWTRSHIYAGAGQLLLERPWTGWGLGSFDDVSQRAQIADPGPIRRMRTPVHAHCDPLQLLVEAGLPAGALLLAAFSGLALGLRRRSLHSEIAGVTALSAVSLFYFPMQLAFPLNMLLYLLGGGYEAAPARSAARGPAILFLLPALLASVYAFGVATGNATIARFDGRLALQGGDADGMARMIELQPERPESWMNQGIYASRHGSTGGTVRGFEAAVNRAPTRTTVRFELVRAWLWRASLESDTAEAGAARAAARQHLGFIRAVEPLCLAGLEASGDPVAFRIGATILGTYEARGLYPGETRLLRRKADPR